MAGRDVPLPPIKIGRPKPIEARGEELANLIEKTRGGKGGGAANRPAPRWAHRLLDAIWEFLTGE